MKKLLLLLLVVLTTTVHAAAKPVKSKVKPVAVNSERSVETYYNSLSKLTEQQKETMLKAYIAGKQYKLENTLVGVAWIESNLGERLSNPTDGKFGSAGTYHALIEESLKAHGLKPTKENIAMMKYKLSHDFNFASSEVVRELRMWQDVHKGKPNPYKEMLASYNAGTKGMKSTYGQKYVADISLRVKAVEKYFRVNKHLVAEYEQKEMTKGYLAAETVKNSIDKIGTKSVFDFNKAYSSINSFNLKLLKEAVKS